jgi:hypothetical protein
MLMMGEYLTLWAIAKSHHSSGELQRRRPERGCTTMQSYFASSLRVGLCIDTILFLLLTGSLEIEFHQVVRLY